MKLYCQYSGVNFNLPQLPTLKSTVLTVHPIFHMDKKALFKLYSDWADGLMESETDRRLVFLAMLNSTDLIDWRATANPTDACVQANMPSLYYTTRWATAIQTPGFKLPKFAITNDTRKLENISHWLQVWENIRENFDISYRTTSQIEKQKTREEMLEKLIKSRGETGRFAGLLCQWAFDAASVPENIRDYWRQILTSKGINIFSIPSVDMAELVEHFEDSLAEHGSIYSYTFLSYIRSLQKQIVTGLGFNITNSLDLVDIVTRSEYSIIEGGDDVTSTEIINIQKIINSAPSVEPVESAYPNRVAFLRAKISWKMASRAAENYASAEEKLQAKLNAEFAADGVGDAELAFENQILKTPEGEI